MPGQDVNVAALKLLPEYLHASLIDGACDRAGKLVLQLGELSDLPPKGVRADPLFADPAPVHDGGLAIPGLLAVGKAAREPSPRRP